MSERKYAIGVDFGTLSGRALLVDAISGEELCESVYEYPHGVMDKQLGDKKLPADFALQHPADYLQTLGTVVNDVIDRSGVDKADICGIGIDFTTCTLLPVRADGTPLCFEDKYRDQPHAYVKLWKHHAAQSEADVINRVAAERGERWLDAYGGKVSSEWLFPKVWQILDEAPEIYYDTYRFVEAGDWLNWMLTGKETHSACFAGYKAMWNAEEGYPSGDFFASLDTRLENVIGTKVSAEVLSVDNIAGRVNESGARLTGLPVGCAVAIAMPDGHVALPALNVTDEGALVMIMGTSTCHIIHSRHKTRVDGICGYVKDGVVPGLYTYEAGQACVGDAFDRFVRNFIPESYTAEARQRGMNIHKLLRERAQALRAGESGLLCLDWFNGNRSVLVDADLTGMILGLTLNTTPEEIYRALIEATAYGTRMIIDTFEKSGIRIDKICASGGIARKDEMMMQIYSDVTGRKISVAGTTQAGALGSAVYACVAGGVYESVAEAARALSKPEYKTYTPNMDEHRVYDKLYAEYKTLHDYFGRGENDVMKRLKATR